MEKEHEIIEKARNLFMKYGFRSITMDDLAHELSISKKTLYNFIKDKADLIRKITHAEIMKMTKHMRDIFENSANTIDRMIKINVLVIEMRRNTPANVKYDLQKYYPEIAEEVKKLLEQKMFEAIKENHELGKKEGVIRLDLETDIIASLQVCRSNIIENIIEILDKYNYEKILNEIFDYHIRAITTPKGLEYYLKNYKNNL
ncbi:MAG: TetR/AcrR family transcriptional regulator [Bacteroidales bacterium]|nr:TetR/AcrR family transcriptional regulator [Bacteroidales bacterium]